MKWKQKQTWDKNTFSKATMPFQLAFFFLSTFIITRIWLDSSSWAQSFTRWATEQAYVRKAIRGNSNVMSVSNFTMAEVFWGHNSIF